MMIAHLKANDDYDETYVDVSVIIPVLQNDTGNESPTTKKLTDPSHGSIMKNSL